MEFMPGEKSSSFLNVLGQVGKKHGKERDAEVQAKADQLLKMSKARNGGQVAVASHVALAVEEPSEFTPRPVLQTVVKNPESEPILCSADFDYKSYLNLRQFKLQQKFATQNHSDLPTLMRQQPEALEVQQLHLDIQALNGQLVYSQESEGSIPASYMGDTEMSEFA